MQVFEVIKDKNVLLLEFIQSNRQIFFILFSPILGLILVVNMSQDTDILF